MTRPLRLHPDRLFASDPVQRDIARTLYAAVADLPIVSPHGHTDPHWFATDAAWENAAELLLTPDHYIFRMLYSQGVPLEELGVPSREGAPATDPRAAWRTFAAHYHLFRGTPSRLWLDHVFAEIMGFDVQLEAATADLYYDAIAEKLASPAFRPRALFDRFGIELLATTEGAEADLSAHHAIRASGWGGRVVTTYRPDGVIDVEHEQFAPAMARFAALTGEDVWSWQGYLAAHRRRRADQDNAAGRQQQRLRAALQGGQSVLDGLDRGVADARVRVALTLAEVGGGLLVLVELESGGQVDRRRPGAGGGRPGQR